MGWPRRHAWSMRPKVSAAQPTRFSNWDVTAWCTIVGLALVFAILAGRDNGRRPFEICDEPHTAERSREMLLSGDFFSVRTNFEPQFKKPPLHYWLTAGALAVVEDRMAAIRLWSLLFGAGCVIATAWVASAVARGAPVAPVAASVLLVSCVHLWRSSGAALLDTGMALFALTGVGCLLRAPAFPGWWIGWGACCACGALHKAGLALPYGAVVVAILWPEFQASRFWRSRSFWLGMGVAMAGFAFWPIVQTMRFGPEALDVFVGEEVVDRVAGRENSGYRIRPAFVLAELFASWPLVGAAGIAWFALGWHRLARGADRRALAIWCIGTGMFLFLTVMSKKSARYTLALVPWISVGLAAAIARVSPRAWRLGLAAGASLLLALPFALPDSGMPYIKAQGASYRKGLVRFLQKEHRPGEVVVLGRGPRYIGGTFTQRLLFESGIDAPIWQATADTADEVMARARAAGPVLVVAEGEALEALMRGGAVDAAPAFDGWRFWRSR